MKMKSNATGAEKNAKEVTKPAFTFSWNKNVKKNVPQSKVFKKKNIVNLKDKVIKPIVSEAETTNSNLTNKDEENNNHKHIKRKQRKDKLLAKKLLKEGVKIDDTKPTNDNQKKNYSLFTETHKTIHVNTSVGKSVSEKVFANSGGKFSDLNIHRHLVSNLEKIDFKSLTNVQEKSIPIIISGRNCLIRSQTGSGKTLAYAIPIVNALQNITPRIKRTDGIQTLIVVPTRELALQTHELFDKINTFQWIVAGHLCGGENRKSEKERLRKGISILIGTPGRLLDHALHTASFNLSKVRCLVLDEADRLLDMGFRKDVMSLVEQIDKSKINSEYDPMAMLKNQTSNNVTKFEDESAETAPESSELKPILDDINSRDRQTILLSATLNKEVTELANFTMKDHVYIDALDENSNNTSNSDNFIIPDTVKQEFLITFVKHRLFTLAGLILSKCKQNSKLFVFMASSHMVEFHYDLFSKYLTHMPKNRDRLKSNTYKGDKVVEFDEELLEDSEDEDEIVLDTEFFKLHGSMDQKMRKEVFTGFRKAKKGVLICTDVAARGIDVPEADCIIQYTPPQSDKDYLHRVGRTGRAGKYGSAIIFLTHEEQDYIPHLKGHKVFLKKRDTGDFMKSLSDVMEQPNVEEAATALQRYFEARINKDKDLFKSACFAYSTWSRYYNSYPVKLRSIFDFKKINLGHYVTSFALTITPTEVSKVVRGQVATIEKPKLHKKLANHQAESEQHTQPTKAIQKKKSISLATSEYSSGLESPKKKRKKN